MMIFVKPAAGLVVRNPDTGYQPLPPEGAPVQDSPYWRAHKRQGAVSISNDPAPKAAVSAKPTPTPSASS